MSFLNFLLRESDIIIIILLSGLVIISIPEVEVVSWICFGYGVSKLINDVTVFLKDRYE